VEAVPAGAPRGLSSNLNVEAVGQSISNLVVVPLSADGSITLFAQTATYLIVDVLGYFTGPTAPVSTDGLFVPVSPARLLDTGDPAKTPVPGPIPSGGTVTVAPLGHGGLPPTTAALIQPGHLELRRGRRTLIRADEVEVGRCPSGGRSGTRPSSSRAASRYVGGRSDEMAAANVEHSQHEPYGDHDNGRDAVPVLIEGVQPV
jgi:hypothetical protein